VAKRVLVSLVGSKPGRKKDKDRGRGKKKEIFESKTTQAKRFNGIAIVRVWLRRTGGSTKFRWEPWSPKPAFLTTTLEVLKWERKKKQHVRGGLEEGRAEKGCVAGTTFPVGQKRGEKKGKLPGGGKIKRSRNTFFTDLRDFG